MQRRIYVQGATSGTGTQRAKGKSDQNSDTRLWGKAVKHIHDVGPSVIWPREGSLFSLTQWTPGMTFYVRRCVSTREKAAQFRAVGYPGHAKAKLQRR